MMADAEAWTPNMALLLFGSCCVLVSYAVTMAVDGDETEVRVAFFNTRFQKSKQKKKKKKSSMTTGDPQAVREVHLL